MLSYLGPFKCRGSGGASRPWNIFLPWIFLSGAEAYSWLPSAGNTVYPELGGDFFFLWLQRMFDCIIPWCWKEKVLGRLVVSFDCSLWLGHGTIDLPLFITRVPLSHTWMPTEPSRGHLSSKTRHLKTTEWTTPLLKIFIDSFILPLLLVGDLAF